MDILRTIIVPSDDAPLARAIAAATGPAYQDMFRTPLSSTGTAPVTHYITSGLISPSVAAPLPLATWQFEGDQWVQTAYDPGDSFAVLTLCEEADLGVTLEEIEDLFANSDVTIEDPWVAMERLGLQMVQSNV